MNCHRPATSPTAQTLRFVVRSEVSVLTPLASYSMPAASRFNPSTFACRPAANQQVAALDCRLRPVLRGRHDRRQPVAAPLDPADLHALAQVDPVRDQRAAHDVDGGGIVPGQDRAPLQDRHRRAEPAVRLGELAPDRPAADDDEVLGPFCEVEDRLVGEVRRLGEARHRRYRGPRARGEDRPARPDPRPVGLDLDPVPGEARLGLDHGDAQALEALDAVVRGDAGDHAAEVVADVEEVDLGLVAVDAEAGSGADGVRRARPRAATWRGRSRSSGSRRPSAPLDEDDRGAHLRSARGHAEAS